MLGDARNHNPCHPLIPLAVVHGTGLAFFLQLSFPPTASGFAPCPPAEALPFPSPGSCRSPRRRSLAGLRWPLWQARGWLAAHALDCQETLQDGPSLARAIAGGSSVFGLPWPLAIAAGSNCGRTMFVARTTSHFSNCGEGAQRPRSPGRRTALQGTMRTALRRLRCNALLCPIGFNGQVLYRSIGFY